MIKVRSILIFIIVIIPKILPQIPILYISQIWPKKRGAGFCFTNYFDHNISPQLNIHFSSCTLVSSHAVLSKTKPKPKQKQKKHDHNHMTFSNSCLWPPGALSSYLDLSEQLTFHSNVFHQCFWKVETMGLWVQRDQNGQRLQNRLPKSCNRKNSKDLLRISSSIQQTDEECMQGKKMCEVRKSSKRDSCYNA